MNEQITGEHGIHYSYSTPPPAPADFCKWQIGVVSLPLQIFLRQTFLPGFGLNEVPGFHY
jgi:hypothetical protein